jgi:hypothetical protein
MRLKVKPKVRKIKDNLAYHICEAAFQFDKRYCSNLPMSEEEWSKLDYIKHYIFRTMYLTGCYLYN